MCLRARLEVKRAVVGSGGGGGRMGHCVKVAGGVKCMYVTRGPGITVPHVARC